MDRQIRDIIDTAQHEQILAGVLQLAEATARYWQALQDHGLPVEQATMLTLAWQDAVLGLKPPTMPPHDD